MTDLSPAIRRRFNHLIACAISRDWDEFRLTLDVSPADRMTLLGLVEKNGRNLLYYAAEDGDLATVKLIVESGGAKLEHTGDDGMTPLQIAASSGSLEVVQYLVEQGANIQSFRQGTSVSALMAAMVFGHARVACFLLEHGANFGAEVKDMGGRTVLDAAIQDDLADVFSRLAARGCFSADPVQPLAQAAMHNASKIIDFCLSDPDLSVSVSGKVIDQRITDTWDSQARMQILSWCSGNAIGVALAQAADAAPVGRSRVRGMAL